MVRKIKSGPGSLGLDIPRVEVVALRPTGVELKRVRAWTGWGDPGQTAGMLVAEVRGYHGFTPDIRIESYDRAGEPYRDITNLYGGR